jgi:hypothetical protein
MTKSSRCIALALSALFSAASAQAGYNTFAGEDLNSSSSIPLVSLPNSTAAQTAFLGGLTGVGVETFEGHSGGAPLAITFPGFSGSLTATLLGGGSVVTQTAGTAGAGRYSIPSATSTNFWQVSAGGGGQFSVDFSTSIAAFGFYGIDIGDYGGTLTIDMMDGDTVLQTLNVGNTVGSNGSTDGSVLYFGAIAQGAGDLFNRVRFSSTAGQGDIFAFDNFTIAEREQVTRVPEPASLALIAVALLGLGVARRRA